VEEGPGGSGLVPPPPLPLTFSSRHGDDPPRLQGVQLHRVGDAGILPELLGDDAAELHGLGALRVGMGEGEGLTTRESEGRAGTSSSLFATTNARPAGRRGSRPQAAGMNTHRTTGHVLDETKEVAVELCKGEKCLGEGSERDGGKNVCCC
jgi:hypothetical protein